MRRATFTFLLLLEIVLFLADPSQSLLLQYKCQVHGCQNGGTCDYDTGKCDCGDADVPYNYNCQYTGSINGDCDCDDFPEHLIDDVKQCRSDQGGWCACKEGYDDTDYICETEKVTLLCQISTSPERLVITVRPYSESTLVYVSSDFDNSAAFDNAFQTVGRLQYQDVHEFGTSNGDCNHMVVDGGEFTTFVYLQHNPRYRSQHDQLIKLTCFDGLRPDSSIITIEEATTSSLVPLESTIDLGVVTATSMQLQEEDDGTFLAITDSSGTIEIGHDLTLVLSNADPFVVKSCTVANYGAEESYDDADFMELKLIDEWCVPADAVALMRDDIIHGDGNTGYLVLATEKMFVLSFDAFTFMGPSRKLYFSCVMCLNNCEMSVPPVCTNDRLNYEDQMDVAFPDWDSRRRRDVGDAVESLDNNSMFTSDGMEVSIEIGVAKNQEAGVSSADESAAGSCYKSLSVLLPLSLLVMLLLVAVLMACYFFRKLTVGPVVKPFPYPSPSSPSLSPSPSLNKQII